jgi:hypothetical protein
MAYEINGQRVGAEGVIIDEMRYNDAWLGAASDEQRATLGAVRVPDPDPVPPTKAQLLNDVRQQATALIQANLPQPWDVLRHLASPEFQAWADDYLGLVAAELARLETAIENDQEAIPDWPEVE